jgi:sporulation protein YlmC with PRC-barrel domain
MSWSQLKNLPVETLTGKKLGHVIGLVIDPETHDVVQYEVKQGLGFSRHALLIGASQVISISVEKMTVEDLYGQAKATTNAKNAEAATPTLSGLASKG